MKTKVKMVMLDIITGSFIVLFVYAAGNKLFDHQKFLIELGKSPVLFPFVSWIVWFLPLFELLVAGALIIQKTRQFALYASFCLMVIFTTYILIILNFSEYIPCSCGGILENMSWRQHFWFNTIFICFGVIGLLIYPETSKKLLRDNRWRPKNL
jgi:uncharacterized membrane protein YphA (DoxX/SURF4 family)